MVIEFACACGKQYRVQEEHAGKRAKCKVCHEMMEVPFAPYEEEEDEEIEEGDPIFDRDVFLMRQKALSISEKYYIWDEEENPLLFVQRKSIILGLLIAVFVGFFIGVFSVITGIIFVALLHQSLGPVAALLGVPIMVVPPVVAIMWMSPKRDITFYRDDTKSEILFHLKQDQGFTLTLQTFTFVDAEGNVISKFSKNIFSNILRRKWWCLSAGGVPAFVAYEDSMVLSILRRLIGPSFGLLRTNFIFQEGDGSNAPIIGEFNRKATILDHYVLDMTRDPDRTIDRRSALALGVLLDTAERR